MDAGHLCYVNRGIQPIGGKMDKSMHVGICVSAKRKWWPLHQAGPGKILGMLQKDLRLPGICLINVCSHSLNRNGVHSRVLTMRLPHSCREFEFHQYILDLRICFCKAEDGTEITGCRSHWGGTVSLFRTKLGHKWIGELVDSLHRYFPFVWLDGKLWIVSYSLY